MSHLPSVILITVGNQDVENPHDVFFQERYSHFPLLLQECELISYTSQPTSIHKNFIILWIILVDRTFVFKKNKPILLIISIVNVIYRVVLCSKDKMKGCDFIELIILSHIQCKILYHLHR